MISIFAMASWNFCIVPTRLLASKGGSALIRKQFRMSDMVVRVEIQLDIGWVKDNPAVQIAPAQVLDKRIEDLPRVGRGCVNNIVRQSNQVRPGARVQIPAVGL